MEDKDAKTQENNEMPIITAQDFIKFFIEVCKEDSLQEKIIQHFNRDVIAREMRRRNMIEPLMTAKELARALGLNESCQGLYKMLRENKLAIPYIPMGRGGGYRFDSKDVANWIQTNKKRPVVRPESLRGRIKKRF